MKFGQLIEYDMRNIFLQTHTQNIVKNQFPDPCYTACFDCMASSVLSKYIESSRALDFTSYKAF